MLRRDYTSITISQELLTRLFGHITVRDMGFRSECWLWRPKRPEQYSMISIKGLYYSTHRVFYALFVAQPHPSQHCDHLCRIPSCVNPAHLEAVTPKENYMRGVSRASLNAKKTHCLRGHPLSGENLKIESNGQRECRECKRICAAALRRQRGVKPRTDRSTHCHKGHELTPENLYIRPNQPFRDCRICRRAEKVRRTLNERNGRLEPTGQQ